MGPGEPQGCAVGAGSGGRVCEQSAGGGIARPALCPSPRQEERALSGTLEASKALLEEQLEAAQERCARLHETQRENLLLRTRLGEAHAVSWPEGPLLLLSSSDPRARTLGLGVVGRARLTLPSPSGAGLFAASGGPAGRGERGAGAGASAEPGATPGLSWGG